MKKLFPLALAAALTLSMGTTVFATDYNSKKDQNPVVPKTYMINNGEAPAETFTFSFTGKSYVDVNGKTVEKATIPAIADVTISVPKTAKGSLEKSVAANITASNYNLGKYTYEVTEKAGTTAGVTYSSEKLYLVLTILRDENSGKHFVAAMHYQNINGNKSTGFTNKYDAGSLSVTKKITGDAPDMSETFDFEITFTAPTGKEVDSDIKVKKPDGTTETIAFEEDEDSLTYEISLGHDKTVTFSNLPAGVTYEVEETNAKGYTSSTAYGDTTKTISANDTDTVTVTNKRNATNVDLGVMTDNLPYVLMLAGAGAGMLVPFGKKYRKYRK